MHLDRYQSVVPVVSGGLDSIALTGMLLQNNVQVYPIFFRRGQENLQREEEALDFFEKLFFEKFPDNYHLALRANIFMPATEIKDFRKLHDISKGPTYFFRNIGMGIGALQYSLQLREVLGLDSALPVLLGSVISDTFSGDSSIEVINAFQETVRLAHSEHTPTQDLVYGAPFLKMGWDKKDYLTWLNENAPEIFAEMYKTWSCFSNGEYQCGTDSPCKKRKDGFKKAGLEDLTVYESR